MTSPHTNTDVALANNHIEPFELRKVEKGNLMGFVGLKIGPMTIHDVRIVRGKDGGLFLGLPQREYVGSDGAKKYAPIIELSRDLKAAALQAVLAHIGEPMKPEEPEAVKGGDDEALPF